MKKLLTGLLGLLSLGLATAAAALHAGIVDVSADTPHSPLVHRLIEWTRGRSVARHSRDIVAPANLADPERIRRGAGNYAAMCADCHLSPGRETSEIRQGLYPSPPNLSLRAEESGDPGREDARRFWIIKHGIKASAMPAWGRGGMDDEAIWDLVAFLKMLPELSPERYRQKVEAGDGHRHGGMENRHLRPDAADAAGRPPAPPHDHGSHAH